MLGQEKAVKSTVLGPWEHTNSSAAGLGALAKLLGISVLYAEGSAITFMPRSHLLSLRNPAKSRTTRLTYWPQEMGSAFCTPGTNRHAGPVDCGPGGMTWGLNILGIS